MEDENLVRVNAYDKGFLDVRKDYDIQEKELEEYPDVFADIINALVYQGKRTVNPDNLKPAATETRYRALSGKLKRQTEDIGKYEVMDGKANVLFLLANQSRTDNRMILRKCGYAGGYYRSQYNGQTKDVCPVMELVLYWGERRWKSAHSIRRFYGQRHLSEEAWRFIDNEKIHVFEMRHLSRKVIERFTGDMRVVLEFLSENPDKSCFGQKIGHWQAVLDLLYLLLEGDKYRELVKTFMDNHINQVKTREGECTMHNWFGEAWEKGKAEGIEQGKAEGMKQGKAEGMKQGKLEGVKQGMISTCRDLNITFDETAAKLKEKFSLEDAEVQRNMALYW